MKLRIGMMVMLAATLTMAACGKDDSDGGGTIPGGGNGGNAGDGSVVTGKKVSKFFDVTVTQHWENGVLVQTDSVTSTQAIYVEWSGDRLAKMERRNNEGIVGMRYIPTYRDGRIDEVLCEWWYDSEGSISSSEYTRDTCYFNYNSDGILSGAIEHKSNGTVREYTFSFDASGNPHKYRTRTDGTTYDEFGDCIWINGNVTAYDNNECEYGNLFNFERKMFPYNMLLVYGDVRELSINNLTKRTRYNSDGTVRGSTVYNYRSVGDYPVVQSHISENEVHDGTGYILIEYTFIEYTDGTGHIQ